MLNKYHIVFFKSSLTTIFHLPLKSIPIGAISERTIFVLLLDVVVAILLVVGAVLVAVVAVVIIESDNDDDE